MCLLECEIQAGEKRTKLEVDLTADTAAGRHVDDCRLVAKITRPSEPVGRPHPETRVAAEPEMLEHRCGVVELSTERVAHALLLEDTLVASGVARPELVRADQEPERLIVVVGEVPPHTSRLGHHGSRPGRDVQIRTGTTLQLHGERRSRREPEPEIELSDQRRTPTRGTAVERLDVGTGGHLERVPLLRRLTRRVHDDRTARSLEPCQLVEQRRVQPDERVDPTGVVRIADEEVELVHPLLQVVEVLLRDRVSAVIDQLLHPGRELEEPIPRNADPSDRLGHIGHGDEQRILARAIVADLLRQRSVDSRAMVVDRLRRLGRHRLELSNRTEAVLQLLRALLRGVEIRRADKELGRTILVLGALLWRHAPRIRNRSRRRNRRRRDHGPNRRCRRGKNAPPLRQLLRVAHRRPRDHEGRQSERKHSKPIHSVLRNGHVTAWFRVLFFERPNFPGFSDPGAVPHEGSGEEEYSQTSARNGFNVRFLTQ